MKIQTILRIFVAFILIAQPLSAAQMSQEEEKKLAAAQRPPGLYNYLQTSANNATQRIRNLFNYNRLHLLVTGGLLANLMRATVHRTDGEPLTPEENFAFISAMAALYTISLPKLIAYGRLSNAIQQNNMEKVKTVLATGFIGVNESPQLIVAFPPTIIPTNMPSPFNLAIQQNLPDIVKLLLQHEAWVRKEDVESIQILPTDTPVEQNSKRNIKRTLQWRLKHQPIERLYPQKIYSSRYNEQKRLRSQYAPVESIATEALEELHKSMYGEMQLEVVPDIMSMVTEYLTPDYVEIPRQGRPFLPIAPPAKGYKKQEKSKTD